MIVSPFLVAYFWSQRDICLLDTGPRGTSAFSSVFAMDFYPQSPIEILLVTGQEWFAPFWLKSLKGMLNLQEKVVHFFHLCPHWKMCRHSHPHAWPSPRADWLLQPWGVAGFFLGCSWPPWACETIQQLLWDGLEFRLCRMREVLCGLGCSVHQLPSISFRQVALQLWLRGTHHSAMVPAPF